jgi:hypothetical protein
MSNIRRARPTLGGAAGLEWGNFLGGKDLAFIPENRRQKQAESSRILTDLRTIAHALGGGVCGRSVICPGPGHSRDDRSLLVTPKADAPDGFLVHSFAEDDWQTCRDYVRDALGLGPFQPGRRIERRPIARRECFGDDTAKQKAALAIWAEARNPLGTVVETYLNGRILDLPD